MRLRSLLMVCTSEFIGTAILLLVGCGGIAGFGTQDFLRSISSMTLTFALAMQIIVHTFGPISGGHANPSVSIAAVVLGDLNWKIGCLYVLFQCLGGITGFAVLYMALPSDLLSKSGGLCVTKVEADLWQCFLAEFLLTAVMIYFCIVIWNKRSKSTLGAMSVHFGFLMGVLYGCGVKDTPSSFNFARSLAPAIFANFWKDFWLYPLAQVSASILVPIVWKLCHRTDNSDSKSEGEGAVAVS